MAKFTMLTIASAMALVGCSSSQHGKHGDRGGVMSPTMAMSGRVIRADCPSGLGPQHLGMPLGADFQPLIGAGAGTLFPQSGQPSVTVLNDMKGYQELVTSTEHFNAALRYGFFNGDTSVAASHRFGIYRAEQIAYVVELHDNTLMRPPPPAAVYYPWRIYMGHSYTEVVEGDASTFTANVGAEFLRWGASASYDTQARHLQARFAGRGLTPRTGSALFAHSAAEVAQSYNADPGQPVPIAVEYRQIPNRKPVDGAIVWAESKTIQIRFTNLGVGSDGAAVYSAASWTMAFKCAVNGVPSQEVSMAQDVSRGGNYPLAFTQNIPAADSDIIECFATGQYKRLGSMSSLGQGTTGPLRVGNITAPMSSTFNGSDAHTNWAVTWTASRTQ